MKIEIELPDWIDKDQSLLILCGQELIAFKHPREEWKIKDNRCNLCGECCLEVHDKFPWPPDDEGKCGKLKKDGNKWICTAGANKPFRCLGDPLEIEEIGCSITYNK